MNVISRRFFPVALTRGEWLGVACGLVLSLCVLGTYYVPGWIRGDDTALLVLYRPFGDGDAYPATRQFGEGQWAKVSPRVVSARVGSGFPPPRCCRTDSH
jgi:hypothetical protein